MRYGYLLTAIGARGMIVDKDDARLFWGVVIAVALFSGEPDLIDGITTYLMK